MNFKEVFNMKLKYALLIGVLSASPFSANANFSSCDSVASLSKNIIYYRQAGEPMNDLVKMLGDLMLDAWVSEIVISAFDTPKMGTIEAVARVSLEFENYWYNECIKSLKG